MQDSDMQIFATNGINKNQILDNMDLFLNCTLCGQPYNNSLHANLLSCNHFLCVECCGYTKNCKFIGCGKQYQIKKKAFYPFAIIGNKYLQQNLYNFIVYIGANNSIGNSLQNMSENLTIEQLLKKCPNAEYALSKISAQNQGVILGTQNKIYSAIRNMTIKELAQKSQIRKNVTNRILIQSREKGGQTKVMDFSHTAEQFNGKQILYAL